MNRKTLLLSVAVVALVLLAGCASLTVESEVDADGGIERYQLQINTSQTVYGFLNEGAKENGYDGLREQFEGEFNESRAESVEYDEDFQGDDVTITLTVEGYEPGPDSNISVETTDSSVVYEDTTFVNESGQGAETGLLSGLSVHYYVTMPGEITDSNADDVDGRTAEWHETGSDAMTDNPIRVESKRPSALETPGFTPIVALAALALFVGTLLARRR
ncbi:MAG: hypothetical protein ACQETI_05880 [Halobacteriota archaeon]